MLADRAVARLDGAARMLFPHSFLLQCGEGHSIPLRTYMSVSQVRGNTSEKQGNSALSDGDFVTLLVMRRQTPTLDDYDLRGLHVAESYFADSATSADRTGEKSVWRVACDYASRRGNMPQFECKVSPDPQEADANTKSAVGQLIRILALASVALCAAAQQQLAPVEPPPARPVSQSNDSDTLGPVNPEKLTRPLDDLWSNAVTRWLTDEHIRLYGWVDGGYTYSSAGHGLLSIVDGRYGTAPTPNRFGDEFILNGAWFIVDRVPSKEGWDWGFRADFEAGTEAALFHPTDGFGPNAPHLGTDYRQIYLSFHAPVLSSGGVDVQIGRQNMPYGYESLMGPYRPLYSETYFWIYFQVVATAAVATWHATDRLDLLGGVVMNYNTVFEPRGRAPAYVAKVTYPIGSGRKTTITGAVYTGPQPVPIVTAHLGTWQTMAETHVTHEWSRRVTQVLLINGSWDATDPRANKKTSKTYGANTTTTVHVNKKLDLNMRAEWFRDERGVRTGLPGTFSEVTGGVNLMPTRWISIRPELRGDFSDKNAYGRVGGGPHKSNELTAAVDMILKF